MVVVGDLMVSRFLVLLGALSGLTSHARAAGIGCGLEDRLAPPIAPPVQMHSVPYGGERPGIEIDMPEEPFGLKPRRGFPMSAGEHPDLLELSAEQVLVLFRNLETGIEIEGDLVFGYRRRHVFRPRQPLQDGVCHVVVLRRKAPSAPIIDEAYKRSLPPHLLESLRQRQAARPYTLHLAVDAPNFLEYEMPIRAFRPGRRATNPLRWAVPWESEIRGQITKPPWPRPSPHQILISVDVRSTWSGSDSGGWIMARQRIGKEWQTVALFPLAYSLVHDRLAPFGFDRSVVNRAGRQRGPIELGIFGPDAVLVGWRRLVW